MVSIDAYFHPQRGNCFQFHMFPIYPFFDLSAFSVHIQTLTSRAAIPRLKPEKRLARRHQPISLGNIKMIFRVLNIYRIDDENRSRITVTNETQRPVSIHFVILQFQTHFQPLEQSDSMGHSNKTGYLSFRLLIIRTIPSNSRLRNHEKRWPRQVDDRFMILHLKRIFQVIINEHLK